MALSKAKLKGKILDIFTTKRMEPDPNADPPFSALREVSPTMIIFAKELSDAYDDYAQDSETYAGDSLISVGKSDMKSLLETLETTGNTAGLVALTISNSILLYWSSAHYAVAPFPPGFGAVSSVIVHPPTQASNSGLEAAMMSGLPDTGQADLWATAIHSQTESVKTTHSGMNTAMTAPKTDSNKDIS